MRCSAKLQSPSKRLEFLRRLNEAVGTEFADDAIRKKPSIELAQLTDRRRLGGLLATFEWFLAEVKQRPPSRVAST
jgi:hypothetical protein